MWFVGVAWAESGSPPPLQQLLGPRSPVEDGVLYVLDRAEGLADVTLYDALGDPVPTRQVVVPGAAGTALRVVVPDAPLAPGRYELADRPLDVVAGTAPVLEPPLPYTRERGACGRALTYRTCGGPSALLAVASGSEPPAPTLEDPGAARYAGWETADAGAALGLVPGDVATVWVGGFDDAGRFTGWWAAGDVAEVPTAGHVEEGAIGMGVSSTVTPTDPSVGGCVFSGWEEVSTRACEGPTAAEPPAEPSGCATAPAGPAGGLLLALGSLRARRRRR